MSPPASAWVRPLLLAILLVGLTLLCLLILAPFIDRGKLVLEQ